MKRKSVECGEGFLDLSPPENSNTEILHSKIDQLASRLASISFRDFRY